jgi:hypothetical protein
MKEQDISDILLFAFRRAGIAEIDSMKMLAMFWSAVYA